MRRRLSAVVVIVAALVAGMLFVALPAFADVTAQEVEAARARLREVNQQLSDHLNGRKFTRGLDSEFIRSDIRLTGIDHEVLTRK